MFVYISHLLIFQGFKDFTNIPTPLALGGLIIGALLIIFLALLKLGIFPMLGKGQAGTLLGDMMKYLFVLALVGLVLAFVGFVLPTIAEMIKGNSTANLNNNTASSNAIAKPTPSIQIPSHRDYTIEEVIGELSKNEGRGAPKFKSNCTELVKKAKLKSGLIGAPDYLSLINNLQHNLAEPAAEKKYLATLTKDGIYEIDCG